MPSHTKTVCVLNTVVAVTTNEQINVRAGATFPSWFTQPHLSLLPFLNLTRQHRLPHTPKPLTIY